MVDRGSDVNFIAIDEAEPGEKLRSLFVGFWSAYKRWFLRGGGGRRPSYARCTRALQEHMPELMPVYKRLCDLVDADDQMARFLSLYRPAPFMTGCSQVIWKGDPLAMIRNYDYAEEFIDGVNLLSAWTGQRTIVMSDCFWGALDGMNEHGLVVALAFGGRKIVGDGFAIPLILRYILETCSDTAAAVQVLQRVPSHMSYNVSLLDAKREHATVFVSPDRPTQVTTSLVCTNHQSQIEWPQHAALTASQEREAYLHGSLANPGESYESMLSRFLQPPLFRPNHSRNWHTLYTASYHPQLETCTYLWPEARWDQSFNHFQEHGNIAQLLED